MLVSVFGVQPIIATLVLMTAGRGIALLITDGQIVTITSAPFKILGAGFVFGLPVAILVSLSVFALVGLLTRRTALGMLLESVGINPEASRLAGVRYRTIVFAVYVFCALCAGIAGLMIASNISAADANNAGLWIEMDAILAVVIGGTSLLGGRFSLTGTILGALIIQTLTTTVYTAGITPETTLVFKALVVIAVCLLQAPKFRALLSRDGARGPPRPTGHAETAEIAGQQALGPVTADDGSQVSEVMSIQTAVATTGRHRRAHASGHGALPLAARRHWCCSSCMFTAVVARYDFASPTQVFLNLLVDNAYLIVLAVGMTFVILTGGIDLSPSGRSSRCPP